jgi:hypothetical protein
MLTAALAVAAAQQCPFLRLNKMEFATALVNVGVELPKDQQLLTDHIEWAKAAVELSIAKGKPTREEFCASSWKNIGPGTPLPLLESIAH